MPPAPDTRLDELLALLPPSSAPADKAAWLERLVAYYPLVPAGESAQRGRVRQAFLQSIQGLPVELLSPELARFLVADIQSDDFRGLEWDSPGSVLEFCELLSASNLAEEGSEERANRQVRALLLHALESLESRNQIEQMLQVLHMSPISALQYPELRRLRNRVYLYEKRRVQRVRRIIYAWLILHMLAVLVIFPLLFIYAENGVIQREIEQAVELGSNDVQYQYFSFADGLYWSIITAGGIGYGDITPVTGLGRALSSALGGMGVVTIGVIAGLILEWISPRSVD